MAVVITAQMVKELRDKTDAGMGDCKNALVQTEGDMQAAIDYLRKAGIAKSENRQDRATKEGTICTASNGKAAVMVEILCETDFVAKNEKFLEYAKEAAQRVLNATSGEGDVTAAAQAQEAEELGALFAKFGEKMVLNRAFRMESASIVAPYVYNGKIALLTEIEGDADEALQKQIGMHIVAYKPMYVRSSEVPADVIEKGKQIGAAQLAEQGKPAAMIEKIMIGKIQKWYGEICFENQAWMFDDKSTFKKLYPNVNVVRFVRWVCGE